VGDEAIAELVRDLMLERLDRVVVELDHVARLGVDQVVVVLARHAFVSRATVAEVVQRNAFSVASGGRQPGEADPTSFVRKGIAGDWKNHFDEECNRLYCETAGEVLTAAGYEL